MAAAAAIDFLNFLLRIFLIIIFFGGGYMTPNSVGVFLSERGLKFFFVVVVVVPCCLFVPFVLLRL